jgi:pimeloyl-ACP methyl ester carboxylesterase
LSGAVAPRTTIDLTARNVAVSAPSRLSLTIYESAALTRFLIKTAVEFSVMPRCDVNGMSLYYEMAGHGHSALFIHGMCGNANVWDGQVGLLSRQLRCVAYDRRGHTRSPLGVIATRTVELHADDAAGLIESLGIAPCVLVASNGGARIGVDLLRRYPELFTAAILSEPPIFRLDPEDGGRQIIKDLQPLLEAALRRGEPGAAVDAFFEYMCPGLWTHLADAQKEPYRASSAELVGDLQMPQYEIAPGTLSRIEIPCAVSGTTSHPVLRRVARVIADVMPHAALVEIEGIGHVTYAEAPDDFARTARQWSGVSVTES